MKPACLVQKFDLETDETLINAFISGLKQADIPYRLKHVDYTLSIWVYHKAHAKEAHLLLNSVSIEIQSQQGDVEIPGLLTHCRTVVVNQPLCLLCISVVFTCFFWYLLKQWEFLSLLTFQDIKPGYPLQDVSGFDTLLTIFRDAQFWRLFTPVFIHMDWHTLLFSLVVFSVLGFQIEKQVGTLGFFLILIFLTLVSNLSHFYLGPNQLFGGMTGIVYGLLSYCLLMNCYYPERIYRFPASLVVFLMITVFLGVMDLYGEDWFYVAYLGPLFAGCVPVFLQKHVFSGLYS